MILKKKNYQIIWVQKIIHVIKRLIFSLGIIFFLLILSSVSYYYFSGINNKFTPTALVMAVNDKILNKYMGFNIRNTNDYIEIISLKLFGAFKSNNLENISLKVNQKSVLGLELQREIKSKTGGPIPDDIKFMYPAKIYKDDKKYDVKIRIKGNRKIHWIYKDKTSYKIDIKGDNKLWEMEEFSFQKPITKNYTYEYLFHKLLGHVDLVNIRYFFVNLFFNEKNLGVYAVEESFSKEILERHKKEVGPIFSIKDELGEYYPAIWFELYSNNYWMSKEPNLISELFLILNNIKKKNFEISRHFDMNKWAKYFAIMDLTGSYHGSLLDSVKLYYNPTTKLFEPIGYDLHKGAGIFDNFILMDFLNQEGSTVDSKIACSFICRHKELYFLFFKKKNDELNYEFINKYAKYLKEYSDKNFINDFIEIYKDDLLKFNNAIYKENSKTDRVNWKGLGFFVFDEKYLFTRSDLIKQRINSVKLDKINISKYNDSLIYDDYFQSKFPVYAETLECINDENKKSFFLVGSMKVKFKNECKKIKLKDFNDNIIILDLKNKKEINY